MSYENVILYGATIPSFDNDKKENNSNNGKNDEVVNLDNPEEWQKVRSLFKNSK